MTPSLNTGTLPHRQASATRIRIPSSTSLAWSGHSPDLSDHGIYPLPLIALGGAGSLSWWGPWHREPCQVGPEGVKPPDPNRILSKLLESWAQQGDWGFCSVLEMGGS